MLSLSNTILSYSGCILSCLGPCSASSKSAKSIHRSACIMTTNIRNICTKDIYISNICAIGTWVGYVGVRGACTRGICITSTYIESGMPKALAGLEVILASLEVNDYCLGLFMGLI